MRACIAVLAVVACAAWSAPSRACTYAGADPQLRRHVAPPGGLWWLVVHGADDQLLLERAGGSGDVVVDVVARGLQASVAVRVPDDLAPGTTLRVPSVAVRDFDDPGDELVVGDEPDAAPDGPVAAPALAVEHRDTMCGYGPALALPSECGRGAGLWMEQWCDHVFARVDVPAGHVLDLLVRGEDVEPLAPLTSANESVFDAHEPRLVDVFLPPPPGAEETFAVHARLRRVVDAAESDVVTVAVERDPARAARVGCVGCSATDASASALFLVALTAAGRARRRPAPQR